MTTPAAGTRPPAGEGLLRGRVAVVTGGGAGIGAAIATAFHDQGATVEVGEIDPERVAALGGSGADDRGPGGDGGEGGRRTVATEVDVRDADAVARWADAVHARHGRVDVLVNNVGHYVRSTPFRQATPEHWDALHDVNLRHVFLVTRAFLDPMLEAGRGSIINVSSVEGMRGYPPDPVYAAYKAAVDHFTASLAGELGRKGIRVNGIAPDLTRSEQVPYEGLDDDDGWETWAPVGRMGLPADHAAVAVFLASDQSSFVTGHTVPVDGGTHAYGGWFWSPSLRRFTNRPHL